jgi:hypothetical protein
MEPSDLARIRFVTRRFRSLQGLRLLVIVPAILASFWLQPYFRMLRYAGPDGAVLGLLGTLAPYVVLLALKPLLDRYYQRRFGLVSTDLEIEWPVFLPDALVVILGLLLELWLKAHGPSGLLIAGTIVALHVTVRDWPWRRYYLFPAVVCATGAWLTAIDPTLRAGAVPGSLTIPLTILLLPQLPAALLDHWLLTRTMPENPDAAAASAADVVSE